MAKVSPQGGGFGAEADDHREKLNNPDNQHGRELQEARHQGEGQVIVIVNGRVRALGRLYVPQ